MTGPFGLGRRKLKPIDSTSKKAPHRRLKPRSQGQRRSAALPATKFVSQLVFETRHVCHLSQNAVSSLKPQESCQDQSKGTDAGEPFCRSSFRARIIAAKTDSHQ